VPLGQKSNHGQLDDLGFAENHQTNVVQEPICQAKQVIM
jgi:hypothetical protein